MDIAAALSTARQHHREGRLARAEALYRQILGVRDDQDEALHLLGLIAHQEGRHEAAAELIGRAVALRPAAAEYRNNLGEAFRLAGRLGEAATEYERALALNADFAEPHNNLGTLLLGQGRIDDAIAHYRRAIAIRPDLAEAHGNLGAALLLRGEPDESIARLRQAVALKPGYAQAHHNLGLALLQARQADQAIAQFREVIALTPEHAEAHFNIGNALCALEKPAQAVASYERALALRPDYAEARTHLGVALQELGRIDEALRSFELAMRARPDFLKAGLLHCIAQIPPLYDSPAEIPAARARFAASLERMRGSLKLDSSVAIDAAADAVGASHPFYLAYQGENDRELLAGYGAMLCDIMSRWQQRHSLPKRSAPPRSAGPIRIGIVTQQVRRHSVWDVLAKGFLAGLERSRFEVYGYHTAESRDAETEYAEPLFQRYEQHKWPIERWLEVIAEDAPDVLIYPEIGMARMTVKLAALRLAPVQICSWGHPDTSGLPTMDYFLSADLLEPPDAQAHYSERLVRLPNLGCCVEPIPAAELAADIPELGIPGDKWTVRFVSCQQAFKFLPQHDAVFPRIARAVGNCKFVFLHFRNSQRVFDRLRLRIETAFTAEGLKAEDYCIFVEELPRPRFLGLLRHMDVYLDTLSFSGFTTALQALQCDGLPIVALEGRFLRSRLAAGLLRRIDVGETIAKDVDQYVDIAVRLARDRAWRAAVRGKVRTNVPRVFGDSAPVRALEEFLERAVGEHTAASIRAPRAAQFGGAERDRVWELLEAPESSHLGSLNPDYVPVGLVDLLTEAPRLVLDVGCFCGATGALLKQRFPAARVVGIEPVARAAEQARTRIDNVLCCKLEDLEFEAAGLAPGSVDVVIVADVLEHLFNPWRALERLRQLLGRQGVVLASIPNVRNLALMDKLARGAWHYESAGLLDITHLRFFTRASIEDLFSDTGYRIMDLRRNFDPRCRAILDLAGGEVATAALSIRNLSREDLEDLATLQFYVKACPRS